MIDVHLLPLPLLLPSIVRLFGRTGIIARIKKRRSLLLFSPMVSEVMRSDQQPPASTFHKHIILHHIYAFSCRKHMAREAR